jgi:dihydroneopterin aldolase
LSKSTITIKATPKDTIRICELAVAFKVGVTEAERAHPQRLLISVEMGCDTSGAAQSDDLAQTIDYHAVCKRLLRFGEGRSWRLIETLASDIANTVRSEFRAATVSVEIKKFVIPEARYVAVQISR